MVGRGVHLLQSFKVRLLHAYNDKMTAINKEARAVTGINSTRAPRFRSWTMIRS